MGCKDIKKRKKTTALIDARKRVRQWKTEGVCGELEDGNLLENLQTTYRLI